MVLFVGKRILLEIVDEQERRELLLSDRGYVPMRDGVITDIFLYVLGSKPKRRLAKINSQLSQHDKQQDGRPLQRQRIQLQASSRQHHEHLQTATGHGHVQVSNQKDIHGRK